MEGRVKAALYALSEMHKASESWLKFSRQAFFNGDKGLARRRALLRKTEGIIFHDRILNGRRIGG
ncbi:hypothetical protein MUA04_00905 [Enterobacteriaceae bacterium H11S18]|uniref:hypothetical protein n=1 Tax=Dryocola clanedunensis TaxID=2925396 RepID=UPI0022EFE426|nr:hypothetical protein [Dryocola clanedunensis]MCT4708795.1 hypothetical protein [Dryocola clanedunensis]